MKHRSNGISNPSSGPAAALKALLARLPVMPWPKLPLPILLVSLAACSGSRTVPPVESSPARPAHFTLLQVNDTYKIGGLENGAKGGFARLRTLRKQLEAGGRRVLVLHAGDIFYPSVMSKYLRAQPIVKIMNELDGDPAAFDPNLIATFGNHEFDDRDPGILLGRTAQADFPWVSSNVLFRSSLEAAGEPLSRRLNNVHETLVRELDGVKLGVFGLTVDATDRDYVRYAAVDPKERKDLVRRMLDRLREQGAQMIVALTHQNLADDEKLAADFPEIDVIAGGHEHFFIQRRVGRTWITKADSDIQSAVIYDVDFLPGRPVDARPRKLELGAEVIPDAQLQAHVAQYEAQLLKELAKGQPARDGLEVVGHTEKLLEGVETAVRGRETALGNFLADVVRRRMDTDVAFVNGGGIRINDNIPPGPITRLDLEGVFYFDNQLVAFELSGAELLAVLNNSVRKVHLGDGRFLQVSGMRFRYRRLGMADSPRFEVRAEDVEIRQRSDSGFKPLDPARRYTVGTTDFIWQSGYKDGYELFAKAGGGTSPALIKGEAPAIGFYRSVEQAIEGLPNKTIRTTIEGRIRELAGSSP
jgi:2',3'-cyclic-nucleotide 2'-phosphodiesterase (5'-nucleotidase family)